MQTPLYRKLDKFRQKQRSKGKAVEITFKEFKFWFVRQKKCSLCEKKLPVTLGDIGIKIIGRPKIVTISDIALTHCACLLSSLILRAPRKKEV